MARCDGDVGGAITLGHSTLLNFTEPHGGQKLSCHMFIFFSIHDPDVTWKLAEWVELKAFFRGFSHKWKKKTPQKMFIFLFCPVMITILVENLATLWQGCDCEVDRA